MAEPRLDPRPGHEGEDVQSDVSIIDCYMYFTRLSCHWTISVVCLLPLVVLTYELFIHCQIFCFAMSC